MTEIKFKAWDKKRKEWDVNFLIDGDGCIFDSYGDYELSEHLEIVQYIGESDKYGNDIYTEDIVKYHNTHHSDILTEYDVYLKVVRVGSRFLQTNNEFRPDMWYEWDKVEVVGNAYQNPELMK